MSDSRDSSTNDPTPSETVEQPLASEDQAPLESIDADPTPSEKVEEQLKNETQAPLESIEDDSPKFTVIYVASVLYELPGTHPVVTLREEDWPYRTVSFPVGLPEAQAIALAVESIEGARPSTHELFSAALRAAQLDIVAARLVREEKGVFFAELDLMSPRGRTVLDCRPTDALILALRQSVSAPILIDETLLRD